MFDEQEYRAQDEVEQYKEVYARFGLAIFQFQVFEHQLLNMILSSNKLRNIAMSEAEYEELFNDHSDKTMGKLIEKVTSLYELDKSVRDEVWGIWKKRNFLAHHYFKNKSFSWEREDQRVEMIRDFDVVTEKTKKTDEFHSDLMMENLRAVGLSDDSLEETMRQMKAGLIVDTMKFREN